MYLIYMYMYIQAFFVLITLHILVFHVYKLHVLVISVCTFFVVSEGLMED